MKLKRVIRRAAFATLGVSHTVGMLMRYKLGQLQLRQANAGSRRNECFTEFLSVSNQSGKRCLQIGVKDVAGQKNGPNWVSVDKYDKRDFIDFNYDIHDLPFEDASFDAAHCSSILEHIPEPAVALRQLYRVLKPSGLIWVQLPFNYPYHEGPHDYWRVSPDGLRIWMRDFREISCGIFFFTRSSLASSTYFYGAR